MRITGVVITEEDLNAAVGMLLAKNGITVPVQRIKKSYSAGGGWEIEFPEPEPQPAPPTSLPADLGESKEAF